MTLSPLLSVIFTLLLFCGLTMPVLAAFLFAIWWHPRFVNWFMQRLQTDIAQHPTVRQAAAQPSPGPHRVNPLGAAATWAIMLTTVGAGVGCGALAGWGMPLNFAPTQFWLAIGIRVVLGGLLGLAFAILVMLGGTAVAMTLTKPRH